MDASTPRRRKDRAHRWRATTSSRSSDGGKSIAEINKTTCRRYTAHRMTAIKSTGTPRRELASLQAAINLRHETHGPLTAVPKVTLPPKPLARTRWLNRSETALLL